MIACAVLAWATTQTAKAMPLVDATALASHSNRLYVGASTGEVTVYDSRTREPLSVFSATRKGPVSFVAASAHGVAWIVGPGGAVRDRAGQTIGVAEQALVLRTPDERTVTVDLKPAGVETAVRALGWIGPRLALLQDFGVAFYNARSGAVELPETFLPKEIAREVSFSRVAVSDPYLLTVRPVSMRRSPQSSGLPYVSLFTAYKFENNRWTKRGGFASNAFDVEPVGELNVAADGKIPSDIRFRVLSETVGFDNTGVAAIEGGNVLDAPIFAESWESERKPLPGWLTEPGRPDSLWFQVAGDDVWWWTGAVLMRQSRSTGLAQAFVPWNDAQLIPRAFLPDATGLWLATNLGVRRIDLGQPDKTQGYGGFLSVPLGPATERTSDAIADKIVKELYRWRFATPDLAGADGARMVSQVLKTVGVILPPDRKTIAESPFGKPVRDEIQMGDVIATSGGLAVYLGNGKTVELKDGVVKNGTLWSKAFATVRRFSKSK